MTYGKNDFGVGKERKKPFVPVIVKADVSFSLEVFISIARIEALIKNWA